MTLADLIDRHRAIEAAYNEARAAHEASEALIRRAFDACTPGDANHDGKQWYIYRDADDHHLLWHSPIFKQPHDVPDARDVVVPAEVLEEL